MNVLIDEGLSTLQQLGGIGYQSYFLWKYLARYINCDITNYQYLTRLPRIFKRSAYVGLSNLEPLKGKYDLIHYQNYFVPAIKHKVKRIATIHDLGGVASPDLYPKWYNAYFKRVLYNTVGKADEIIMVSEAAKNEFTNVFSDYDRRKIHVCYNGIRPIFFESQPSEDSLKALDLDPYSYFLFIGNLERRKNLPFLMRNFIKARSESRIVPETKLVLVGKLGIGFEKFGNLINKDNMIVHLGRLSDDQLVNLYKYSKAFIFPSLYEGFGIPIIEAMSQNVPILISNIPPSVELNKRHNDQCFVFDVLRSETFIDLLSHLDKNFREVTSGLNYGDLSIYSYDNAAQQHIKIYTKSLNG